MSTRDYYEVLGVDRNSDDTGLKKAFRKLALEFHPDRNPSEEAAHHFREAQEAYSILSDPEKRALYDRFGHAGVKGRGYQDPNAGFGSMDDVFSGFQSIFDDFFGGAGGMGRAQGGRSRADHGDDLLFKMQLDFKEAALGCVKEIEFERAEPCHDCKGSGAKSGTKPETCAGCQGRGKISRNQGFFMISQTCPDCRGEGKVIRDPCKSCRGEGRTGKRTKVEVKVPAGVDTGIRLRMSNEGGLSPSGKHRGDLYVELSVRPDAHFSRDGVELYSQIHVPYPLAVLGGEFEVQLLEGTTKVKIPAQMKAPYQITVKGEGVQDLKRHRRGDLIIEAHIDTPKHLTIEARELIQKLQVELSHSRAHGEAKKTESSHHDHEDDGPSHSKKKKKKGFFS